MSNAQSMLVKLGLPIRIGQIIIISMIPCPDNYGQCTWEIRQTKHQPILLSSQDISKRQIPGQITQKHRWPELLLHLTLLEQSKHSRLCGQLCLLITEYYIPHLSNSIFVANFVYLLLHSTFVQFLQDTARESMEILPYIYRSNQLRRCSLFHNLGHQWMNQYYSWQWMGTPRELYRHLHPNKKAWQS